MKLLWIISSLMLPLCIQLLGIGTCIFPKAYAESVATSTEEPTTNNDDPINDEEEIQIEVLQETLAAGRGHRDEVGERDQWSSTEHLGRKEDIRKPPSAKVRGLLKKYQLSCDKCDHDQAVAKINAFVLEAKQDAERQEIYNSWLERAAKIVTVIVLGGLGWFFLYGLPENLATSGHRVGGGPASTGGVGHARRLEIEEQRRRAAQRLEQEAQQEKSLPPTWRENEEREIWTPKQEKQFAKALVSFGGVPAKARYTLIADKVDGKTRQECLMHHKLLQAQEADEQ